MASSTSDDSPIEKLPCELHRMIMNELSDEPSAILALAQTCTRFYAIHCQDQEIRLKHVAELTEELTGVHSPLLARLAIMRARLGDPTLQNERCICHGSEPSNRFFVQGGWVVTATDLAVAKSAKFTKILLKAQKFATLCGDNYHKFSRDERYVLDWVWTSESFLNLPPNYSIRLKILVSWAAFDLHFYHGKKRPECHARRRAADTSGGRKRKRRAIPPRNVPQAASGTQIPTPSNQVDQPAPPRPSRAPARRASRPAKKRRKYYIGPVAYRPRPAIPREFFGLPVPETHGHPEHLHQPPVPPPAAPSTGSPSTPGGADFDPFLARPSLTPVPGDLFAPPKRPLNIGDLGSRAVNILRPLLAAMNVDSSEEL
ncbi:hypothetical protein F5Y10DRAFT_256058 [Nemania abortiva]|nr:hypothetical protein F5Y10DRAFT_256058 [Nemania abortiva]